MKRSHQLRRQAAPAKSPNMMAMALAVGIFKPRVIRPGRGRAAYRRKAKHYAISVPSASAFNGRFPKERVDGPAARRHRRHRRQVFRWSAAATWRRWLGVAFGVVWSLRSRHQFQPGPPWPSSSLAERTLDKREVPGSVPGTATIF